MLRTWWCRNERARAAMWISSPTPRHLERVERLDRRFRLAQRVAEGREIVVPDQMARRPRASPRHRAAARRARPGRVRAPAAPAGSGCGRDSAGRSPTAAHRNRRATGSAASTLIACGRRWWLTAPRISSGAAVAREIDMRDLGQRVHPGIGAPGAEHGDALAAEALRPRFPAPPASTARSPGAASRQSRRRQYSMVSL